MAKKDQIWKDRWLQLEHLGKGGQGLVYKTKDVRTDISDYVFKILKEQKNKNKRARMYREVAAYKTLTYKGIPALVDSNVELFESDEPLFIVTEYIPGPTLDEFIRDNGPLDLDSSITFVLSLLRIVKYSHGLGIIHRDIKPDNIILREGRITDIFLIDFGLSFNNDDEQRVTPSSEQLTNRFLHLPELNNQSAKADFRTDITYCAGILFFVLTGKYPIDLVDHDSKMPHQREFARLQILKLPSQQAKVLQAIFDRTFITQIDYRYQSIEALESDLKMLMHTKEENNSDPEKELQKFKETQRIMSGSKIYSIKKLFSEANNLHTKVITELIREFGDLYGSIQTDINYDYKNYVFRNRLGIRSEIDHNKIIWPTFSATITGSEVIFGMQEDGENGEIFRSPLSDIKWDEVRKFIRDYFLIRLNQLS